MKIVALHVSNIKRLRAVDITPEPGAPLVVVTGKNGAGKSSVLDSIMYALGGGRALPTRPVRDGEAKGEVVLELDDYLVKRRFTADGGGSLTVSPRGVDAVLRGPQAILDDLVGELSFDPLDFARMKASSRREQMLRLAGLGTALEQLDGRRRAAEQRRRDAGRDADRLQSAMTTIPAPAEGETGELVDASALAKQLQDAHAQNRQREAAADKLTDAQHEITDIRNRIAHLQREIAQFEEAVESLTTTLEQLPHVDTAPIAQALAESTAKNTRAAEVTKYLELKKSADQVSATHAEAQADLDAVAAEKAAALANAKLPIDGLGIADDEVTYNGIPFDQLASSEQLRVSLAMAMALNPKLRVIRCTDGSLLDAASLQIVRELAAAHDYQIWIERVDDATQGAIVIEDGAVVEVRAGIDAE